MAALLACCNSLKCPGTQSLVRGADAQHLMFAVLQQPSLPSNYSQFLDEEALERAVVGVFDSIACQPQADCEVQSIFEAALAQMDDAGVAPVSAC